MKKENKPAGSIQKSLLFLAPLAVTTAAAVIGLASLKPVPTELPEKLAYADPTAAPTETEAPETTPDPGAETTEVPSAEPSETPEIATEPPATDEPSDAPETKYPEQSTAPTASATATPKPTATPAVTQAPQQTVSPTSAPTTAPTATPKPTATPTAAPTEAPGRYKDGSYTASERCADNGMFDYTVEVTVVVSGGDITSFNAVRKDDVSGPGIPDMNAVFMENALGSIRSEIIREQSADNIDVVSGATYSSNAIIKAAKTALSRASKSVSGVIEPTVLPGRRSNLFEELGENSEAR